MQVESYQRHHLLTSTTCFGLPPIRSPPALTERFGLLAGTGLGLKLLSHHLRIRASHRLLKAAVSIERGGVLQSLAAGRSDTHTVEQNGLRARSFDFLFILYTKSREGRPPGPGHVMETGWHTTQKAPPDAFCSMRTLCTRAMKTVGYGLILPSRRGEVRRQNWAAEVAHMSALAERSSVSTPSSYGHVPGSNSLVHQALLNI